MTAENHDIIESDQAAEDDAKLRIPTPPPVPHTPAPWPEFQIGIISRADYEHAKRCVDAHDGLVSEIARLRALCAAAYQVVGAADGPVEMLDNLSDAGNGDPLRHDPGAGLPWVPASVADAGGVTDEAILNLAGKYGLGNSRVALLLPFARAMLSQAQGQKGERMFDPARLPPPDEEGFFCHPDVPEIEEDQDSVEARLAGLGWEATYEELDYYGTESDELELDPRKVKEWAPNVDGGWQVVSKFMCEDGVFALTVRPRAFPSPDPEREKLEKDAARVPHLEELVLHLRHCRECGETDLSNCFEGGQLWIDAAMQQPSAAEGKGNG
jgi:hypothetical protein